jgi:hypothetical protein
MSAESAIEFVAVLDIAAITVLTLDRFVNSAQRAHAGTGEERLWSFMIWAISFLSFINFVMNAASTVVWFFWRHKSDTKNRRTLILMFLRRAILAFSASFTLMYGTLIFIEIIYATLRMYGVSKKFLLLILNVVLFAYDLVLLRMDSSRKFWRIKG